jgi:hypothetical protein
MPRKAASLIMLEFILSDLTLGILIFSVVISLVSLHFLLFREYSVQERIQRKRLKDLEKLVLKEVERSENLSEGNKSLNEIKGRTQEQLNIIKLQVEAMDVLAKKRGH